MNTKTKRRMVVVTGIIVMVLVVVLAVVGGSTTAKAISVADAASGDYAGQRVQVSGNVVENSFETKGNTLTFDIHDPDGDGRSKLRVNYEGGVAATFGNDVTAICTGKIAEDGTLFASELVTKCPSKYENATDALGVAQLLGYKDSVLDKPVKITGTVEAGSLLAAGQGDRFTLVDTDGSTLIPVLFEGALSEEIQDGSELVVTGSLTSAEKFAATDVALKG